MEDKFGKYFRLFGTIFFTFVGFLLLFLLVFAGLRLLFGFLDYVPWFVYVYMLFILAVPSALFITAHTIYFQRTTKHPSTPVRWISYVFFTVALIAWIVFFVLDLQLFFKHNYNDIAHYHTYNLLFLSLNVGGVFFIGVIQALSTEKEVDWMERHKGQTNKV